MQIQLNGESHEAPAGTTLGALVDGLELQRMRVAVELNCELIPREQIDEHEVHEGDRVEIVTLVGGG